ncbi:hypothetical protein AZI85_15465 [Bdellovibrio bacteriovorus]|uniref:Uncharacterized protein n=1 Tax=Bdellovibrio bacteriovorus TaxID=959 RepID=A0A150WUF8_BDEBC|nr:DUF3857 domain-containing protein [Bdellovibrio bacteriovorus]KYG70084.1 hypothetical protein AZI85_15465 [Bdellovibrio bacteriovorus]
MIKYIVLSLFIQSMALADWAPLSVAPYEILSMVDTIDVDKKGLYTITSEASMRVLNEQGRNTLVLKKIPFLPESTKITVIRASSITDGVETMVDLKTVRIEAAKSPEGGLAAYKDVVIPFTNLKVGSTITYRFVEKKTKQLIPGHFSVEYNYGMSVPEAGGHLTVKSAIPIFFAMSDPWKNLEIQNIKENEKFVLRVKQKSSLYKLPIEFGPIIRKENATRIQISSINNWRDYLKSFAGKYEKILEVKKLPASYQKIADLAKSANSVEEKINIVTSELASIMTYSGDWTTFEKMFVPRPLNEVEKLKTGDCKDFSIATVAILRNLGISAEVALTHRKSPSAQLGMYTIDPLDLNLVLQDAFNHAIVKVKNGQSIYWVDPTNIVSNASTPFSDITGSYALEVSTNATGLERIPYPSMGQNSIRVVKNYNIREDNTADTTSSFRFTGVFAKAVLEIAHSQNKEVSKKILMAFNRTDPKDAQGNYTGVNFNSRISTELKGVEKASGDRVLEAKDSKLYFSAPLSFTLNGLTVFNRTKRITDMYTEGASEDNTVLKVDGYDFVGFQEGCTILTPWFTVERAFIKTQTGFEVRDQSKFFDAELKAEDINSDKFSTHLSDIFYDCAATQTVEVVKLQPGQSLSTRLKDYSAKKAKELMEVSGPTSITSARHAYHITENLLSQNPKDKDALIQKLRAIRRVGYKSNLIDSKEYYQASDSILKVLLADYPNDTTVLTQRVWSAYFQKNPVDMTIHFQKLYPLAPKNYEFYTLGGAIAEEMKRNEVALGSYLKAFQLAENPRQKASSSVDIAGILINKGEIDKGIAYYKQAISLYPENTWTQGNLMSMLSNLKRYDEAIQLGETIMKENPYGMAKKSLAEAYRGKALEYYKNGRQTTAADLKSEAGEKLLRDVEAYIGKGLSYYPACGKCLVSMAAVYRIRASLHGDKDYAMKAKTYYDKANQEGEISKDVTLMSSREIDVILGTRSPAGKATLDMNVNYSNYSEVDLQR